MARIRTIKPSFFRHFDLYTAERKSKLPLRVAFAGLWTAADRDGRFKWRPSELKLDCLPHDEINFLSVLDALATHGFIKKYACNGKTFGYIPTWHEHQSINKHEKDSALPSPNGQAEVVVAPPNCRQRPKKEKTKPSAQKKCVEYWNEIFGDEHHKVRLPLSSERAKSLKARVKELGNNLDGWKVYLQKISASDFLTGKTEPTGGRKPFALSFDWATNATNFQKIMEDRYDNDFGDAPRDPLAKAIAEWWEGGCKGPKPKPEDFD